MGDVLNNIGGTFSPLLNNLGAYVNGLIDKLVAMVPAQVMDLYNTHTALFILAAICLLGLVAFEGFKLFRMLTYAGSAFLFGLVGFWYVAPALESVLKPMIPDFLDYHVLIGVVCSLIAVLLCACAFNFVIFIIGGAAGYLLGSGYIYGLLVSYFSTLTFLQAESVKYIVGVILAVIGALSFALMFKTLFLLATSFGGAIAACSLLQIILIPAADINVKIGFEILGIVLAIAAFIRARKQENDLIFRL